VLNLENICFKYSNQTVAAQDISLTIAAGEFVAIAGRNGSGKTTLTKLIMSLLKPTSGSITFRGENTKKFSPADMARYVGYVFQNPDRQIFRDTVALEVAYGPEQLGFSPAKLTLAVEKALQVTGLEAVAGAYPRALSKGQKQKVAIASALAMEPEILILDEPTSGQDSQSGSGLMELLAGLNAGGCTVLLVTHNMELLAKYASRTIIMDQGTKAYDGSTRELFSQARDIAKWGLREPATTAISRALTEYGIQVTEDPRYLAKCLVDLIGGARHA